MKHNTSEWKNETYTSDRSRLAFNFCTVTLEEQHIMERNEKELISVKTINTFNIICYISNGPKKDTCKAVFKNIFITTTCDCKHENINFMKL